jgi:hypothetical protein
MSQDPAERRQRRHEGRARAAGDRSKRIRRVARHELDVALAALEALPDDARVLERTRLLNIVGKATRLLDSIGPHAAATRKLGPASIPPLRQAMAPRLTARDRRELGLPK